MQHRVVVIDYGSGNLHSMAKALEKTAPEGCVVAVSDNPKDIEKASHIVLPGVGAFGDCIRGLESVSGIRDALEYAVQSQKKPFLGVCVGMQMLADEGLEHGCHKGLGWIQGRVVPIAPENAELKVPHMGWNQLAMAKQHPVFNGIEDGVHAYFVHSFHFECENEGDILAQVEYGVPLTAAIARGNIVATQFHPEKSQAVGLRLLANFLMM